VTEQQLLAIRCVVFMLTCLTQTACEPEPVNLAATAEQQSSPATASLGAVTVNYPLEYFTQRIGGNSVSARYPGPANEDPAYWNPDIDTVVDYQQAGLIVLNGAGYAGWTKRVSLPLAKQIDTSAAFTDRLLAVDNKVAHTHGPTGEHVHDDLAFTVWLDPELAGMQADAIHAALVARLPEHRDALAGNLVALKEELDALDTELAQVFAARDERQIIYSHPVYQYLDRRYALDGISMHWEPDELPSEQEFAALESQSGALMLWEAEPLQGTRARLTAMGIKSVVFDPCATQPESGDYLDVMRANIQRLETTLP
jgi:zinc transport system substrate-binding protein